MPGLSSSIELLRSGAGITIEAMLNWREIMCISVVSQTGIACGATQSHDDSVRCAPFQQELGDEAMRPARHMAALAKADDDLLQTTVSHPASRQAPSDGITIQKRNEVWVGTNSSTCWKVIFGQDSLTLKGDCDTLNERDRLAIQELVNRYAANHDWNPHQAADFSITVPFFQTIRERLISIEWEPKAGKPSAEEALFLKTRYAFWEVQSLAEYIDSGWEIDDIKLIDYGAVTADDLQTFQYLEEVDDGAIVVRKGVVTFRRIDASELEAVKED